MEPCLHCPTEYLHEAQHANLEWMPLCILVHMRLRAYWHITSTALR